MKWVKAIIEFRKVAGNWPNEHLADDALYQVGVIYVELGETEKAREALLAVADKYPNSPLADDALFMVGKSHEDEAQKLAAVTRALGRLGDLSAVEPLLALAAREDVPELVQAMAVVSMGRLLDSEPRPSLLRLTGGVCYPARSKAFQEAFTIL